MSEQDDFFDQKDKIDTILLMRLYDVLIANLAALDTRAAERLVEVHEKGGILMPPVAFDPDWKNK